MPTEYIFFDDQILNLERISTQQAITNPLYSNHNEQHKRTISIDLTLYISGGKLKT